MGGEAAPSVLGSIGAYHLRWSTSTRELFELRPRDEHTAPNSADGHFAVGDHVIQHPEADS